MDRFCDDNDAEDANCENYNNNSADVDDVIIDAKDD